MGSFLQQVIRSGSRPLARRNAARRSALLPVINAERVVVDGRDVMPPQAHDAAPAADATPDARIDTSAAIPAPVRHVPPAHEADGAAPPAAARHERSEPAPRPVEPTQFVASIAPPRQAPARERDREETLPPRALPEPQDPAHDEPAITESSANRRANALDAPTPRPSRVETIHRTIVPDFADRVTPPRESSAPERLAPVPRRVEFQTVVDTRVVRERAIVHPASTPAQAPLAGPPPLPAAPVQAPPPVTAPKTTEAPKRDAATPREPPPKAPAVSTAAPIPAPVRREAESTITIRQIDIQIVGDEQRRTADRAQPAPGRDTSHLESLRRLYVREAV